MSAEQGWIGEPQQKVQWHESHYSRMADRIARELLSTGKSPSCDEE
jgi:uncharacterized protein with PIN domain